MIENKKEFAANMLILGGLGVIALTIGYYYGMKKYKSNDQYPTYESYDE